jgi:hypothetical protein
MPRHQSRSTPNGLLRALIVLFALAPAVANACDICAVYIATEVAEGKTGFRAGVAEQYTHFGTLQDGGTEAPNPFGERLDSAITQFLLGYQFTDRLGLQLNVPLIARTFRRLDEGRVTHGDETGIGDIALIADFLAFSRVTDESVFRFSLLGGLKLPTGDPDHLADELNEGAAPGGLASAAQRLGSRVRFRPRHATGGGGSTGGGDGEEHEESGIHGHDLALGSGSVDGIVGGSIYWSYHRFFVTTALQYAARTEGSFDYQFANDLTWDGGPGVHVLLDHRYTLSAQAVISGETKGQDTQKGERFDDTAITALYVGPGIHFTWGTSLAADLIADLPAVQNNTALQIVPDYRIRGGVVYRF